jgi:carboxymethylenebutenolidase
MIEEPVAIRTADGTTKGFFYRPEDGGPRPGVLYFTDIRGVRPAFRSMAQKLAQEGYCVLMPNVFYRTGEPPFLQSGKPFSDPEVRKEFESLVTPLTPEAMARDLAAYVDDLAGRDGVADGPVGAVGHCFTGQMALRAAAARPDKVGAVASFHGGGLYEDDAASPHLVLPQVRARLYFGHADQDGSMPEEAIRKLEEALNAWGGRYESEVYSGARHGWTVTDSAAHDPARAERAYGKLTALLRETLQEPSGR